MRAPTICLLGALALAGCQAAQRADDVVATVRETRDGRESVWGVSITLSRGRFVAEIPDDQLSIVEWKYRRELNRLMDWSVSDDRKTLRVVFRQGMGDFGTSNAVTVRVTGTAVEGDGTTDPREWRISTDE